MKALLLTVHVIHCRTFIFIRNVSVFSTFEFLLHSDEITSVVSRHRFSVSNLLHHECSALLHFSDIKSSVVEQFTRLYIDAVRGKVK